MAQKSALVVIDVQNALCTGKLKTFDAEQVIANINHVINSARVASAPIIFVQHETLSGAFIYESDGWQLSTALDAKDSDIFIRKSASDAFRETDLQTYLDKLGIKHLVICGMQSEFCVDSSVRCALAMGFSVTIVADGHTTLDNAVIPAAIISRHHNHTWENITSYGVRATAINAKQIEFSSWSSIES